MSDAGKSGSSSLEPEQLFVKLRPLFGRNCHYDSQTVADSTTDQVTSKYEGGEKKSDPIGKRKIFKSQKSPIWITHVSLTFGL